MPLTHARKSTRAQATGVTFAMDSGPKARRLLTVGCQLQIRSVWVPSRFGLRQPPSEPTARAITSRDVSSAAVASMPINALAREDSGMVSVGLNALELVSETYR